MDLRTVSNEDLLAEVQRRVHRYGAVDIHHFVYANGCGIPRGRYNLRALSVTPIALEVEKSMDLHFGSDRNYQNTEKS